MKERDNDFFFLAPIGRKKRFTLLKSGAAADSVEDNYYDGFDDYEGMARCKGQI